jgi:pyruvate/2-oxoglutarate dehydrogenase complex dihydrolipoamide acyltransferase (E2) component
MTGILKSMSTEVLLPKIGFSMNDAVLSQWLIDDGAQVVTGQPLYSIESDKSVQEIESPATGTLRVLAAVGETYTVGTVLAEIV